MFLEEIQERAQVYRDRDGTDPYPLGEVVANEWGYAYFYAEPNSYRITSAPLAIDWREVVVAGEWLLEAESNAAQSAAQALLSAQSATASAATASDSAAAASDSAANAESSETNAAGSAASAQSSATQASSSAADAATYRDQAQGHATAASNSASDSETSRLASESAKIASEAARDKAQQWAQNPEDDPVETGQYSAYHWAKKAEGFVGGEAYMQKSANLSDVQDAAQARTNLGLGAAATRDVGTEPNEIPTNDDLGSAAYLPIATAAQAQALTNDATVITPKKLGDAMNAHVLGMGQTWQNMSGQRESGTTYTNTTGRTIAVSVSGPLMTTGGKSQLQASVGGVYVVRSSVGPASFGDGTNASIFFLVPPGAVYSVTIVGTGDFHRWVEMR